MLNRAEYEINPKIFQFETKYGLDRATIYKWPAHEVKLTQYPDKDIIVYKSKSGWSIRDRKTGETIGKMKVGAGWFGFGTAQEAVDNYMKIIREIKMEREGGVNEF